MCVCVDVVSLFHSNILLGTEVRLYILSVTRNLIGVALLWPNSKVTRVGCFGVNMQRLEPSRIFHDVFTGPSPDSYTGSQECVDALAGLNQIG